MLFRVRRWIAVMLTLALLPAVAGGAQCASHDAGAVAAAADGGLSEAYGQRATPSAHAHHSAANERSLAELTELVEPAELAAQNSGHAHHAAPLDANGTDTRHESQTAASSAPENCCPPTSVPGACSSAMGCGVVSVAQADAGTDAMLATVSVTAAPGSVLPPGPSRAPDVPPPRT